MTNSIKHLSENSYHLRSGAFTNKFIMTQSDIRKMTQEYYFNLTIVLCFVSGLIGIPN